MKTHLIIATLILVSCTETKRFSKWKDRGEKHGWLLKDTLYFTDTIRGFTKDTIVQFDTLTKVDTLTVEKNGIKTVTVIKWKDRIVSQVITQRDTIKHYAKPIFKDCPPCPKVSWWKHFIPHGFIFYGLITMIFWIINLILKGKRL